MKAITKFDTTVLNFLKKHDVFFARLAIFIVYFWFGALKLFGESPANPLVQNLLTHTLPFISFQQFITLFALFEMLIGVLFLIPGLERLAAALLVLHLVTTFLPLILLPSITWQGFLVPTLEGQYIIKNVLIIALTFVIAARMKGLSSNK